MHTLIARIAEDRVLLTVQQRSRYVDVVYIVRLAKAELDQVHEPSGSNAREVAEAKVEAACNVAKEKCDDQKGDAKATCVKQAKAEQPKGKADIKAMTK